MGKVTNNGNFHKKGILIGSRIMTVICMLQLVAMFGIPRVYAAGYTGPITKLKTVLITIAGAVGVVIGIYGAIKFAMAFKNHDNQGEQAAVYTLVAAGILIGISAVLSALGV